MWTEVAGALIGGAASAYGAKTQQETSNKMAKKQMAFQERMSNTAHQRQVADLRKAGLNPILSANSGASSPGGAMGQAQNIAGAGVQGAGAGLQMANIAAQTDNTKANTALTQAQTSALTLPATIGEGIGSFADFVKEKGATTADQMKQAFMEYQQKLKKYLANQDSKKKLIKGVPSPSGAKASKVTPSSPLPSSDLPEGDLPSTGEPVKNTITVGGKNYHLYTLKSRDGKKTYFSLNGMEFHTYAEIKKILQNRKKQ